MLRGTDAIRRAAQAAADRITKRQLSRGQELVERAQRRIAEQREINQEALYPEEVGLEPSVIRRQRRRRVNARRRADNRGERRARRRRRRSGEPEPPLAGTVPYDEIFGWELYRGNPNMVTEANERNGGGYPTAALADAAFDELLDAGVIGGEYGMIAIAIWEERLLPFVLYVGPSPGLNT